MGDAVFVPGGTWHNVMNAGNCPLKLSSVYAPPKHPGNTAHRTKADAEKMVIYEKESLCTGRGEGFSAVDIYKKNTNL